MKNPKFTISRRSVLAGTAALGVSGLVAGCDGGEQTDTAGDGYRGGSVLHDAIVIGAGLSGLHAARLLEQQGLNVLTLEGRNRLGGRVYTLMDVPGNPEAGGEWIGGNYARMLSTARDLNLDLISSEDIGSYSGAAGGGPPPGKYYIIKGEGISAEQWPDHKLNPLKGDDRELMPDRYLFDLSHRNNPLSGKPLDDWIKPEYKKYDISHADYMREYLGMDDEVVRLMNITIHTEHIDSTSAINELRRYAVGEFNRTMAEQRGQPRGWQIEGGNSRITTAMAETLTNGVLLEKTVHTIEDSENEVTVHCTDGTSYRAKQVVNSMPLSVMRDVKFTKRLPELWADAIAQMTYGISMQMHFQVDRPFWEDDGLPANMWTDEDFERFAVLKNGEDGEVSSAIAYVNGIDAYRYDFMSDDQVMEYTQNVLAKARPSMEGALTPLKVQSCHRDKHGAGDWMVWQTGQVGKFAAYLREPHGNIHFAGEHTALMERGMEGAFESGERAAFDLLTRT
ncbi:flavin monoamine oxidase family protein [Erythrobacter sp. W53]|uniref:flavin monoamine oxidase family protein n=1 Tax=Erythrobacter sp. W53 TaxID=3425947 RepID=UPI003D766997